jgi:hypothetical protein
MQAYIYQADLWCEDCGNSIRDRLDAETKAPDDFDRDDETTYDSDEYPKGPYPDGGGEADCPQHCAAREDCLNAVDVGDGHKIGCHLENGLTADGEEYVRESLAGDGCCVEIWADFYALEPSERTIELCSNTEWLFVFGPLEEPEDSHLTQDEIAGEWWGQVCGEIEDNFTNVRCIHPRSGRILCHGWNGANTFARCGSGLGTFDDFSDGEWNELEDIATDLAEQAEGGAK